MHAEPTILFGHPAYRLGAAFASRRTDLPFVEVQTLAEVERRLPDADVLVVSRLWRNDWIDRADRLRFIQSVSAGTEQFDTARLRDKGIRLASAQGANAIAVAEHALALTLSLTRHLHRARDNQGARRWRPLIGDPDVREMELAGRTMAVVGLGRIGGRIAQLASAFGMRVLGVRRSAGPASAPFEAVFGPDRLAEALGEADVVVLACPLTPDTDRLIDAAALAAMKPSALLVNVARGRVVDEQALADALRAGRLAGAGLDCFVDEPLAESSPLWGLEDVVVTPHTAGETRAYEARIIDLLVENLSRLADGRAELRNQIV